jgi:uncharacterized protein (TIGR02271 family)
MDEVQPGMPVVDADGPLGTLESLQRNADGGATVVVRRRGSIGTFVVGGWNVANDTLRLHDDAVDVGQQGATAAPRADTLAVALRNEVVDLPAGQELVIPVLEEVARIGTRTVQGGGVRVHKTVSSREEVFEQPVMREEISVERVAVGQVVDIAPQARREGETLIVPVLEEITVVNTQLVLVEEVRITRRRTSTVEQVPVVLRKEHVEIEQIPDPRTEG